MSTHRTQEPPKVGIVSLGCPKALVDSERILTRLRAEGYDISPSYEGADVVIVNTCGFLDSAKAESLDAIGEAMAANGKVVVTGCMGIDEKAIRDVHPGVLSVSGPQRYDTVVEAVHRAIAPPHAPYQDLIPPQGLRLTPRHYAYLKISEGCDHHCSFCIIPSIRGGLVSRPVTEVLAEAEDLADAGVREIMVIAQDTGAYGRDVGHESAIWYGKPVKTRMTELAAALGDLGIWIRMHYVYPYPHVAELMPLMAEGRILPYLDVPFQHASPRILKAMKRPAADEKTLARIGEWRAACPDLVLRSTFIVGFPGETEDDFQYLLDWMQEARLDRVGCFKYEAVAGAAANDLPGAVPEEVKQDRWERFMEAQQAVSAERLAHRVDTVMDVLIDEVDEEGAIGRTYADAPEIDGVVYLDGVTDLEPGDMTRVLIEDADAYDLWGTPIANDD